ncbi:TauD/TfdA dioxygenase family protein [Derxia lacustris]|uniref:TauD/TfdA dioxygenase family protein n=1 Tax=Derxia lacustris TaxID=764842 RepID=UPI000A16E3AF|nr:TauD/TfdA family dioxygenase [Derxia lacustris]
MSTVIAPVNAVAQLVVRPLEPTIGAELSGIDLRQPLGTALRDEIKALLLRHRVLFFRDQPIDSEQQIAFARQFGKVYEHPTTSRVRAGVPDSHRISAVEARQLYNPTSGRWHTDTSWLVRPTWGAILRDIDLPPTGGDTIWADGHAVYEALPEALKQKIDGLYVTHDFQSSLKRAGIDYPIVAHPLVKTHPETGEKIVWANWSMAPWVVGWDRADSKALLDELLGYYARPEFQVRFKWTPHSVVFWDNRAGLHYPVTNYGDYPRELERVLIEDHEALPH